MSLETGSHIAGDGSNHRPRPGAAGARLPTRPARRGNHWRCSMTLLPGLKVVLNELTQRFGPQIEHAHAPRPNELYLHTKPELSSALCSAFYKKYNGRLAGVFAEDGRAEHGVFFVYHLYALDSAHGFVLVRIPVPQ